MCSTRKKVKILTLCPRSSGQWERDERGNGWTIGGPISGLLARKSTGHLRGTSEVISGPISGPMARKKSNSLPERMSWLNFRQTRKAVGLKTMLGDIEKG